SSIVHRPDPPRDLHSFPTRRSSDLQTVVMMESMGNIIACDRREPLVSNDFTQRVMSAVQAGDATKRLRMRRLALAGFGLMQAAADRKSTRLNSSHLVISYAVFCLKK